MHPQLVANSHPERTAVVMDDGETRTYAALSAACWRIAALFDGLGLRPGDHVALLMTNGPEMLEVLWGAHSAGLLYTACSTELTPGEVAFIVNDCDARVLITSAGLTDVSGSTPKVRHRFSVGGRIEGHEPLEEAVAKLPATPRDDAVAGASMLYSSGTTGRPKGIRPGDARRPLYASDLITEATRRAWGFEDGDVYLSPSPLYHAAPLWACMSAQRMGGTVVLMRSFDPETTLALIEAHRVTHAQFVPTMFNRLLRLDEDVRAAYDVSSLRSVIHGAAPCPVEIKRAMIEWWGPIIGEYYGATEAVGSTWITSEEWLAHPGSVGRASVGNVHIVDEATGEELPPGETGTIYFSGGPSFEYHNDAAKTASAYNGEGWATVGDIGRLDEDGYLYLSDRKAHLIITGGVNVYPQETENVLATHPLVLDAAVFGIPDDDFGEQVKAVVAPVELPADDAAATALEATLIAHCRSRLARYKCPRSIDFRAELPRHETGKLYKRELAAEYRA